MMNSNGKHTEGPVNAGMRDANVETVANSLGVFLDAPTAKHLSHVECHRLWSDVYGAREHVRHGRYRHLHSAAAACQDRNT